MGGLFRDPYLVDILGGGFGRIFLKYALYTCLALTVVYQYGGSFAYASLLVGLYSLIGAVIATQSARLTERMSCSYALLVGFVIAGTAFVAFLLVNGLIALTALVLFHRVGEGIINLVHKSIMNQSVGTGVRGGSSPATRSSKCLQNRHTPSAGARVDRIRTRLLPPPYFSPQARSLYACGVAFIALIAGDHSPH